MDIKEFLNNIPVAKRERESVIKYSLNSGKIAYISIINKNNKKTFKLYFLKDGKINSKQLKFSDDSKNYILKNKTSLAFSDTAKKELNV